MDYASLRFDLPFVDFGSPHPKPCEGAPVQDYLRLDCGSNPGNSDMN